MRNYSKNILKYCLFKQIVVVFNLGKDTLVVLKNWYLQKSLNIIHTSILFYKVLPSLVQIFKFCYNFSFYRITYTLVWVFYLNFLLLGYSIFVTIKDRFQRGKKLEKVYLFQCKIVSIQPIITVIFCLGTHSGHSS